MKLKKNIVIGLLAILAIQFSVLGIITYSSNLDESYSFGTINDTIINGNKFTQTRIIPANFSREYPIFGYKLIPLNSNPIDRDEDGILKLTQSKLNFFNITIQVETGYYKYKNIPISGKVLIDLKGNSFYIYNIEDPLQGFFMILYISEEKTFLDLAFDGGYCQLIYNGLVLQGYSQIDPVFTQILDKEYINDVIEEKRFKSLNKVVKSIKDIQLQNIDIYKRNTQEPRPLGTILITHYGIAHECADFSTVNLAEDLPDEYWEPYTEIDIGIYRRTPSEATIKSDLQYYNKKYYSYPSGDFKYVDAYAVYAHGSADLNTAWFIRKYIHWIIWPFWYEWIYEYLYPNEVKALWYEEHPYPEVQTEVYPIDMILHATVCEGYSGNDGIPHMAKAFVDYGATAFIGAPKPCSIPALHNDEFTGAFWKFLCQYDKTVYTATIKYINTHNQYHDYPGDLNVVWVYGTHIKIYGDLNGILQN